MPRLIMKRIAILGAVLALLACGSAEAMVSQHQTREVVQRLVRDQLAVPLSPKPRRAAPHRVYDCSPGSCRFWVHGTSDCAGMMRVIEGAANYSAWYTRLSCQTP